MKKFLFLVLVVILAVALRFWRLDGVPMSLYIDEIDQGYQALSLLETGKDYRGGNGLVVARSYNADRLPLSVWGTMVSTKLFSNPFYQVRGGSAIAGVLVVICAGLLVWRWSGRYSLVFVTMVVFALSPWMLQFSRIAFEGMFEVLVLLIAWLGWWFYLRKKGWWYLVFFGGLGLSLYTYRSMSLLVWVVLFALGAVYWREVLLMGWRRIMLGFFVFFLLAVPHYWYTMLAPSDELRINQISVFSEPMVPIWVMRNRELASGDYGSNELGRAPVWWSRLIYNKAVSYLKALGDNYLKVWSTDFLFVSGDPNPRHNPQGMGMLYRFDILGLIVGLWYLVSSWRRRFVRFLAVVLVLSPLGSVVTTDGGNHAHRLLVFGVCVLLVVSLGWYQVVRWRWWGWWVFGIGYVLVTSFYLVKYHVNYPFESFRSFGYGYREAVLEVARIENDFSKIELTQSMDPPIFYYLFWNKVPPAEVIEHGTNFSSPSNQTRLSKYRALEWDQSLGFSVERLEKGVLYVLSQRELPLDLRDASRVPKGLKLWRVILYPDGTPAMYLVSRT